MADKRPWKPVGRSQEREAHWWPVKGLLKRWRSAVLHHLVAVTCNSSHADRLALPCAQSDTFSFGVFTGRNLRVLAPFLARKEMANVVWGFDSFRGIPEDAPPQHPGFHGRDHGRVYANMINHNASWKTRAMGAFAPGQFSAVQAAGAGNIDEAMRTVSRYVASDNVQFVPGFFNESLTASLAAQRAMRPAMYVDIDVDIYLSTYQALDWLCASGLLINGTVIGYDDFNQGLPPKVFSTADFLEGEARAHREIGVKWGLQMRLVRSVPRVGGQAGWAFSVRIPPESRAAHVAQIHRDRHQAHSSVETGSYLYL